VGALGPAPDPAAAICRAIAERGPAVVALSGGVDSSLVASFAREALGDGSVAVSVTSGAVAPREIERARDVALAIGIRHVVLGAEPLARDDYRANTPRRCYVCRTVESSALLRFGVEEGFVQYLDGIHADDMLEDRPGVRAMDEAGFRHPLLEARWTKADVRAAARARGLPNWDLPSDACLASRVAHGIPISSELLARVASAETVLLERGFRRVRVRVRADRASIEVDPWEVARLSAEPMAGEVTRAIRALGFPTVVIDPHGYGGGRPAPLPVR
jgi:pyridinium-3,5-biscarboxylic acid mononucleotide sulfurtransferase